MTAAATDPITTSTAGILRVSFVKAAGAPTLDGAALDAAVEQILAADASVRVILISHPGKHFCVGGDVGAFASAEEPGSYVAGVAEQFHAAIRALTHSPLPVVAAVQGWAAGAGMSIVAAADIAVAGTSTQLRAAYPGIGFTPDGGMSWSLPRAVGRSRALDILLTNRAVGADEALAIGLVARVVADDHVQAEAEAIAQSLATGSTAAYAGIKKLVDDGLAGSLDEQLDAETLSISQRADSPDGREGVRAFIERRAPQFG